jgi:hypothetical protein
MASLMWMVIVGRFTVIVPLCGAATERLRPPKVALVVLSASSTTAHLAPCPWQAPVQPVWTWPSCGAAVISTLKPFGFVSLQSVIGGAPALCWPQRIQYGSLAPQPPPWIDPPLAVQCAAAASQAEELEKL